MFLSQLLTKIFGVNFSVAKKLAKMNLEIANKAIKAAICESERYYVKSNIAVVDAGANLVAFARMDNAPSGTVDISIKKAKTAASFQVSTGHPAYNGVDFKDFITVPGGVPIFDGKNVLIGGIGVSGSTGFENDVSLGGYDVPIANAGKNAAK